jgi:4-oxalocrotonate tautomerase
MPFVDIKVIEDVFTHDEKREAVQRVSEALLQTWGEGIRDATHVVITETPSGEWAVGGRALTADDVKQGMLSKS